VDLVVELCVVVGWRDGREMLDAFRDGGPRKREGGGGLSGCREEELEVGERVVETVSVGDVGFIVEFLEVDASHALQHP
jgi:hypothetical protein